MSKPPLGKVPQTGNSELDRFLRALKSRAKVEDDAKTKGLSSNDMKPTKRQMVLAGITNADKL